jgi:hypothetical protein
VRAATRTAALAAVALALGALNLLDRGTSERLVEQLPVIASVPRDDVVRIELSSALEKIVLERIDEQTDDGVGVGVWHVRAPLQGDADPIAVRTLLNNFRKDIALDAKVDAGNLEEYGLDSAGGLVVELFTKAGGEAPAASLTLGKDAPGGSSFVRLSGDDAIYRARMGGRHKYERPASEWRNRVVMGFDEAEAVELTVRRAGQDDLRALRLDPAEEGQKGRWALDPDPGFPVDQLALTELLTSLGGLRAGELLPASFDGGFSPPLATVEVKLADGSARALEVGTASQGAESGFARRPGGQDVYRVAASPLNRLLVPIVALRDHTLFNFGAREVDTLTYEGDGLRITLQQDLSNGAWRVVEPDNLDLDLRLIYFMVNTLRTLRAAAEAPADLDPGATQPSFTLTARMLGGAETQLRVGQPLPDAQGRRRWVATTSEGDRPWLLLDEEVLRLRQGFGR